MRCSLSFQGGYNRGIYEKKINSYYCTHELYSQDSSKLYTPAHGYCSIKQYKNGPCESRSHDLHVISTTLYRLSQRTRTLHRAVWIVVCEMEKSCYYMKDIHYSTMTKFVIHRTIVLYESTYLFFLKRHK